MKTMTAIPLAAMDRRKWPKMKSARRDGRQHHHTRAVDATAYGVDHEPDDKRANREDARAKYFDRASEIRGRSSPVRYAGREPERDAGGNAIPSNYNPETMTGKGEEQDSRAGRALAERPGRNTTSAKYTRCADVVPSPLDRSARRSTYRQFSRFDQRKAAYVSWCHQHHYS